MVYSVGIIKYMDVVIRMHCNANAFRVFDTAHLYKWILCLAGDVESLTHPPLMKWTTYTTSPLSPLAGAHNTLCY